MRYLLRLCLLCILDTILLVDTLHLRLDIYDYGREETITNECSYTKEQWLVAAWPQAGSTS